MGVRQYDVTHSGQQDNHAGSSPRTSRQANCRTCSDVPGTPRMRSATASSVRRRISADGEARQNSSNGCTVVGTGGDPDRRQIFANYADQWPRMRYTV